MAEPFAVLAMEAGFAALPPNVSEGLDPDFATPCIKVSSQLCSGDRVMSPWDTCFQDRVCDGDQPSRYGDDDELERLGTRQVEVSTARLRLLARARIRGGRRSLRTAPYRPALVALRFNPDLKQKYQDLKDAGKPSKVAITAIMRKLLVLANAPCATTANGTRKPLDQHGYYAVIVDEAHSSQTGETAAALRGMLNRDGIGAAIAGQLSDIEADNLSGCWTNCSLTAWTATRKSFPRC